eukprot:TRINITY_DN16716_c0_g1_i1.p1 TRINITY_DN16716_c0_g1~~TRINITY_DN16716_c0_g1_i1.p1  ORF type:complete len:991 (+),score=279.61 TRINITY_DN16716_c0_g1_i1:122-2974(+)
MPAPQQAALRAVEAADAVEYLRGIDAPDIFDELTSSLLEHRPPKERVYPFLAATLLALDARHDASSATHRQRVLGQLPHAETAPAAAAIFACAEAMATSSQGVLDLSIDSPDQGRRPSRWQIRTNVEHNPFGACPARDSRDQWTPAANQAAALQVATGCVGGDSDVDGARDPSGEPPKGSLTPRDQHMRSESKGDLRTDTAPDTGSLASAVCEMIGLIEGAIQTVTIRKDCPKQVAARVIIGARATDFEKGVLVVPNRTQWKFGEMHGGQDGIVLGVGIGSKANIRVRWPGREYMHHRADRSLRLAPMSAWRATVDVRLALERPGDAIGAEGARAVSKVLRLGVPLREILLRNNQVGADGARALLDGARHNKHLLHVDLGVGPPMATAMASPARSKRQGSVGEEDIAPSGLSPAVGDMDPASPDLRSGLSPGIASDVPTELQAALLIRCAWNAAAEGNGEIPLSHLTNQGADWVHYTVDALWDTPRLRLPCGDLALKHTRAAGDLLVALMAMRLKQQQQLPQMAVLLYAAGDGCGEAPGSDSPPGAEELPRNPKELLAELLRHGGEIGETDVQGRTPLHLAAEFGKIKAATELLQNGADPCGLCDGRVPAFYAALHPDFRNRGEGGGWEVLKQMAVPEALKALGTSESFPGAGDGGPPDHFTCLHAAAWEGSTDAVSSLVELGAPVDVKSARGHYPLTIAARDAAFDAVPEALTALAASKSVLTEADSKGRTALHWACNKGRPRAVAHLISLGADITLQTSTGRTPLHEAMRDMRFESPEGQEAVKLLATPEVLKTVAEEANASNMNGGTPLHSAAFFGRSESIRTMVSLGADLAARNTQGHCPIHRSCARGHLRALETFIELGADVNARTPEGKTPLDVAEGHPSVWQGRELDSARRALVAAGGTGASTGAEGAEAASGGRPTSAARSPPARSQRRGSKEGKRGGISFL